MALVTHHLQGSYATFPSRPLSWSKGVKLKQHVTTIHMIGRPFSLRRKFHSSVGTCIYGPKVGLLKISAFKGSAQNAESGGRANGSNVSKNSVKVSYVPKESAETLRESPQSHDVPVSYTSEADERIVGSAAIHKLFKKWLNMLRTPLPSQVVHEIVEEGPSPGEELPQSQSSIEVKSRYEILKMVWSHFMGIDVTIKLPILIFIPLYLAVNVIYGPEVSKELTPLWIFGPLIVALYIKVLQSLWALYVFSFKEAAKVVKNLPTYCVVAYGYIREGKLKEDIQARVVQPVVNIKNLNYKELSKTKMKVLVEWIVEKYLDFVESVWPYYCRTIRFLKKANLM